MSSGPISDISVVIPVRDAMQYLPETLESVCSQTLPPAEIIVVDDGSLDRSPALAAEFSPLVSVVSSGGIGPEGARTVGCEAAAMPVIALCDADDLWHPFKLEMQRSMITDVTTPMLVWTGLTEFVSPEIPDGDYTGRAPQIDVPDGRLTSNLMMTRVTLDVAESSMAVAQSWVSWIAGLPDSVAVEWVPDILVRRRLHLNNLSLHSGDRQRQAWLRAARSRVQRQRDGR